MIAIMLDLYINWGVGESMHISLCNHAITWGKGLTLPSTHNKVGAIIIIIIIIIIKAGVDASMVILAPVSYW